MIWRFWSQPERRATFAQTALTTTLFRAKWLTLAFSLECLMLAWIPVETVTAALGGEGLLPIVTETLMGGRPIRTAMQRCRWWAGLWRRA